MTIDDIDFEKGGGLITVVAQDANTGAVLMVAHMDRESFARTVEVGEMHYRSRTRGLWHKGATSGNVQKVVSLTLDCDADAILARVIPAGPACHKGTMSCFNIPDNGDAITALASVIESRIHDTDTAGNAGNATGESNRPSYTRKLLDNRNLRLKKLGEETAELVLALADNDIASATGEAADLLYHMMVALRAQGITVNDVRNVLAQRAS